MPPSHHPNYPGNPLFPGVALAALVLSRMPSELPLVASDLHSRVRRHRVLGAMELLRPPTPLVVLLIAAMPVVMLLPGIKLIEPPTSFVVVIV